MLCPSRSSLARTEAHRPTREDPRALLCDRAAGAGVRQTANVVDKVRTKGVGVAFITHNVRHALAIGDRPVHRGIATLRIATALCDTLVPPQGNVRSGRPPST